MNGNPSASYAQLRAGSAAGADFSAFKQNAGHQGPTSAGAGFQEGNRSSGSFVFESKSLAPDKPLSISRDTGTSLLGARAGMGRMPGME